MKPHLVIVGLGNPGASYEKTRHNAGMRAVAALSDAYGTGAWREQAKFRALTQEARIVTAAVLFVKPQTYMNDSGSCVRKFVEFYKLDAAQQLLILCDDVDLPLGELRLRMSGGPGTHNGLKSIVDAIGEGFPRMRIGLGVPPAGEDLAAWVLSLPVKAEQKALDEAIAQLPEKVKEFVMERASE